MATRRNPAAEGAEVGRRLRHEIGRELRAARLDRGLSAASVGRAAGVSASTVSRIERGLSPALTIDAAARLHAVVGLRFSGRSYPGGEPIRDAAQVSLLRRFRARTHPSLAWQTEVPLLVRGDLRAWDATLGGDDFRYGVEAETSPHDSQATARRIRLKIRDGDVTGALLVLADTVQSRRFLAAADDHLRASFPVDGDVALARLALGHDPGGSAIIVIRRSRRHP